MIRRRACAPSREFSSGRTRSVSARRPPNVVERAPQVQAKGPNDVWTVDFKGWWKSLHTPVIPLVEQAHRLLLAACDVTGEAEVRARCRVGAQRKQDPRRRRTGALGHCARVQLGASRDGTRGEVGEGRTDAWAINDHAFERTSSSEGA